MSLLAAAQERQAGPIGLVVILCLSVALVFLVRSMNKHLRKVPGGFAARDAARTEDGSDPERTDRTP